MPMPDSLSRFFQAPGMYVQHPSFDSSAAFLQGFDVACGGRILVGFREWLILKLGSGSNLAWTELFLRFAFPESLSPRTRELTTTDPKYILGLLTEVFAVFWAERETSGGLESLMQRHTEWLESQDWYRKVT